MQRAENKNHKKQSVDLRKHRIGIVVSEFNSDITEKLLGGAVGFLKERGIKEGNLEIVRVPGSFEIPLMCQRLARTKKFSGLIALGAVIKGDTDHYYYIAGEASRGVMSVMLSESMPIGFGVITVLNLKQAKARSSFGSNKGVEAAEALVQMIERFSYN